MIKEVLSSLPQISSSVVKRGFNFEIGNLKWSIKLVFDLTILDDNKFYFNRGWNFGQEVSSSVRNDNLQGQHEIYWDLNHDYQSASEMLFSKPISLKKMVAIWAQPEQVTQIINLLKTHHFVPSNGLPLEKFVIPYNRLNIVTPW